MHKRKHTPYLVSFPLSLLSKTKENKSYLTLTTGHALCANLPT